MADLFKSLKPDANIAKNGFDLSRKHVFSSNAGQLLPVLSVETVPGDHFEIDLASLSRSMTFNTAAFVRGKQRYDFFFVPYSQLWHPFNQFITQRTDKHSTRQLGHIYCPVVALSDLLCMIVGDELNQNKDMFNQFYSAGLVKILDLLGYGNYQWIIDGIRDQDIDSTNYVNYLAAYPDKYVNIFRLAAYQHIWYDYYRNKYYDVVESGGIDATSGSADNQPADYILGFNFDDIQCSTFANSQIFSFNSIDVANFFNSQTGQPNNNGIRLRQLLQLRYCQWKKDIFTSALPSQQFGVVSSVDINLNNLNFVANGQTTSVQNHLNFRSSDGSAFVPASYSASGGTGYLGDLSVPSAFDVLSLRKAEALQAWKQNTLRAGNMTDDSFKAHYGVEPYYEGDENVHYLGSFSAALQVNAVEATAESGTGFNSRVGDIAATGTIVVNGNKLKFDAKDFGIIMCMASYLPESEYESNSLDKANKLFEQFDFYTPEFQNIGLEAVPLNEAQFPVESGYFNQVIGYAPRYYMYKTAVDKVFGNFSESHNMRVSSSVTAMSYNGNLMAWVTPRREYVTSSSRNVGTFYVDPRIYNNVFGVSANFADQFLHNVYFDIKAIRPMSVLGLPQF